NPDVQVLVSRQDAGDAAVTKLLTAVRAGNGAPDVVQAEYQSITSLVAFDAIDDISEDLDPGTAEHFAEGIWSSVGIGDGGVYAIPRTPARCSSTTARTSSRTSACPPPRPGRTTPRRHGRSTRPIRRCTSAPSPRPTRA